MASERSTFGHALAERNPDPEGRRWIFVAYDQLTDGLGPLSREDPAELGIVLVENPWKAARRPYHRQKIALVLANLRHFALEQAERGVAVRHLVAGGPYRETLKAEARKLGGLRMMRAAERELRADLEPLVAAGALEVVPHEGWLTTDEDFDRSQKGGPPWRMDAFYREVRRRSGLLMEGGKPLGGQFSFDGSNREPWSGEPEAPEPPRFTPDEITSEVGALVEERFDRHPGRLDLSRLPASRDDAERLWNWALDSCLESFGPYEDAMSSRSRGLFHTRIAPLLNLHRLLPRRVVDDALAAPAPLESREGFLRQVIGWREFVRRVHERTDGFRELPDGRVPEPASRPGDGGWSRSAGRAWSKDGEAGGLDGGACPSHLGAAEPLPAAYWGEPSGLRCLDEVVASVWDEGYSHHITRLMILSNLATLLDLDPRELTDWFWCAYIDAYDWVVEPNVLGMGTFALGELFTTKPYVSGSNYIAKMSDYCGDCAFDPKRDCPIASLYWAFLERHADRLGENRRLFMPYRSLAKRAPEKKEEDRRVLGVLRKALAAGERVGPATFENG